MLKCIWDWMHWRANLIAFTYLMRTIILVSRYKFISAATYLNYIYSSKYVVYN